MINYICLIVLVALGVKFIRTLGEKWGIIEYLQAHAPNQFFYKLFSCEFCQSFWLSMIICGVLVCLGNSPIVMFVPIFSSCLR